MLKFTDNETGEQFVTYDFEDMRNIRESVFNDMEKESNWKPFFTHKKKSRLTRLIEHVSKILESVSAYKRTKHFFILLLPISLFAIYMSTVVKMGLSLIWSDAALWGFEIYQTLSNFFIFGCLYLTYKTLAKAALKEIMKEPPMPVVSAVPLGKKCKPGDQDYVAFKPKGYWAKGKMGC